MFGAHAAFTILLMGLLGPIGVAVAVDSALPGRSSLRRGRAEQAIARISNGTTHAERYLTMEGNATMMADHMESDHSASFQPLPCNDNVDVLPCDLLWSELFPTATMDALTGPVKIECGTCVKLDVTGDLSITTGLNIEGKLVVDSADYGIGESVTMTTPFVIVQGILEIKSDRPVSPADSTELLKIILEDDAAEVDLSDHVHSHNAAFCKTHSCSVGTKPIVVAGGKLDIQALPAACPSWTSLEDIETRPMVIPQDGMYPSPAKLSPEQMSSSPKCPSHPDDPTLAGAIIDSMEFDSDDELGYDNGQFNGHWAMFRRDTTDGVVDSLNTDNPYLRVTDRIASWQGPMINMADHIKCMVPDQLYILTAMVKLQPTASFVSEAVGEDGVTQNTTKCASQGKSCLQGVLYGKRLDGTEYWKGLGNSGTDLDAIEDNVWYEYSTVYTFAEEHLLPGIRHRLYFDGPEAGVDILFDHVRLAPAPVQWYPTYANSDNQVCSELLMNGGAELGGSLSYPFYANNGQPIRIEQEEDASGVDGAMNSYFSLKNRWGYWHSIETELTPSCVKEGDVYSFFAKLRVHADGDQLVVAKVMIKTTGSEDQWKVATVCPAQTLSDGWVTCQTDIIFDAHQAASETPPRLYFEFRGLDNEGNTVDVDYASSTVVDFDDLTLSFKEGPAIALIVSSDVQTCWGEGSEILVTSHTLKYDDEQVRTITSSEAMDDPLLTRLVLDKPVPSMVTTKSQEDANPSTARAVEVALLSRNVVFTAATAEGDKKSGGHLMIFHTNATQKIEGVELSNFGQAGNLGRYPLHFHMCGSSQGSLVSKNLVRESFQRCYVLHGSHNVTLSSNVAYNTFGHCYFLEDGAEEDNLMEYNLGALTKRQPLEDKISDDETDDDCATFWLTNPVNSWEGNVAAGSEHSGFWFEMRDHVRGPSRALYPDKIPKNLPLKYFNNNVAHSNAGHGLQTYPGAGYTPDSPNQAVFENMQSFRNKGAGVFFHNSQNLAIDGGFFADNRIGVDFDRVTTTRLSNAVVTGFSPLYQEVAKADARYGMSHCPSSTAMVGLQLHTYWSGENDARGFAVDHTSFTHLGAETTCEGSHAINVDNYENRGYFDIRTSLNGLKFDTHTEPLDLCSAKYAAEGVPAIDFVAIRDLDGSVMGEPGFLLSDSPRMTNLLPNDSCTSMPNTCAVKCPGLCVRSKYFKVSSLTSDNLQLRVTDTTNPTKEIVVQSYIEYNFHDMDKTQPDDDADSLVWRDRTFHVVVPQDGGPYNAEFEEENTNGTPVAMWPRYVEMYDDDAPGNCGSSSPIVNLVRPAVEPAFCEELLVNGDISNGADGWLNNAGGINIHQDGVDGGLALKSDSRTSSWHGLAQFLDTRCLVVGDTFEFTAQVKLALESDETIDPGCDAFSPDDTNRCPSAYVKTKNGPNSPQEEQWIGIATGATDVGAWSVGEWNTIKGTIEVNEEMANCQSALFYFTGPAAGVNMIVDQVSIKPYVEQPDEMCSDVILDEQFTNASNGWSGNYNWGGYELATADSHEQGNSYLWVHGRSNTWDGPMTDLDIRCMTPGLYFITAKAKFHHHADFTKEASTCQTDKTGCLSATYYRTDNDGQSHWKGASTVLPIHMVDGEWFDFAAHYTFTETDLTPGKTHRLYFEGAEANIDIMMDNVRLWRAPSELAATPSCSELIVNGDAELAPPFATPLKTNAWKTNLIIEEEELLTDNATGTASSMNHYFSLKNRYGYWHGAEYYLPTSCVTEGAAYTFSVKIRVHSTTPSRAKIVLFSQTDVKVNTDKQWKLLVHSPSQTIEDGWVNCQSDYTFTAHQAASNVVKFYVEVPEDINAVIDYDDFSFVPNA